MIERDATSTKATVPASAFATKATSVRSGGVCAADALSVRHDAIAAIVVARMRFIVPRIPSRVLRSQSPVGAEPIHFWLAQRRGQAHGSEKRADDEKNT